ncbi:hypothetical protein KEM55_009272 [Ascosphaera atra]|nr:hypothetical protein KEM55_009272 [Ascosphaera atra]
MADAIPSRPPTSTIKHYASNPITFLTAIFLLYKTLLLLITLLCPGPGYDTSTTLLPGSLYQPPPSRDGHALALTGLLQPAFQFVRWDALYFLDIARRGYAFEQQWAFSYAHGRLMAAVARVLGFGGRFYIVLANIHEPRIDAVKQADEREPTMKA